MARSNSQLQNSTEIFLAFHLSLPPPPIYSTLALQRPPFAIKIVQDNPHFTTVVLHCISLPKTKQGNVICNHLGTMK